MQIPSGFLLQILNNEKDGRDGAAPLGRLRTRGKRTLGVHLETTLHSTMILPLSRGIWEKHKRKGKYYYPQK